MSRPFLLLSLALGLLAASASACGADTVSGACLHDDANGNFCITYSEVPGSSAAAVESGCSESWGGTWTEDGQCPGGTLVGTCTLTGGATGDAASAVMEVYEPTDASIAEDDICGSDGSWQPAP